MVQKVRNPRAKHPLVAPLLRRKECMHVEGGAERRPLRVLGEVQQRGGGGVGSQAAQGGSVRHAASRARDSWYPEAGGCRSGSFSASRPLRVVLVGHQFQVPSEGQAKAAALAAAGELELHVLVPDRYREAERRWRMPILPEVPPKGVTYHRTRVRLPWSGPAKWYLQSYAGLGALLRRIQPDILDVWEEPWNLLSAQVCRVRERFLPAAKLISETEQNVSKQLPPPFEQFRSYTLRRADFLIGRNAEAVSLARAKGFMGPARVVGNGFDGQMFSPASRREAREHWGITGFAVGYAGRLVSSKGLHTLRDAVRTLSRSAPVISGAERPILWLAGEGPLEAEFSQCPDLVRVVGALDRPRLARFFSALDVLVLPSLTTPAWKEQFGRVIIEAQGCGIPVVGSSSGAIPEVLGEPRLIFPEGDAGALAAVLERLRGDTAWGARVACEGRQRAIQRYSWEAIAGQMLEVYRELGAWHGAARQR